MLYESPYLAHYGVQGQKWGIRRYQNEDGTLTEEGKARYGDSKTYKENFIRRTLGSDLGGELRRAAFTKFRESRLQKAKDSSSYLGRAEDIRNREKDLEIQKAANANMRAYREHTSTGKLLLQNLLFLPVGGGYKYRSIRAAGGSRLEALIGGKAINVALAAGVAASAAAKRRIDPSTMRYIRNLANSSAVAASIQRGHTRQMAYGRTTMMG